MNIEKKDSKIILISGKARSGKDTTMGYIKMYYEGIGKNVINLQFSSCLKEYAKKVLDWDGSEEEKPRDFLQLLSTEIIRKKIDEEFFIKRMIQDIEVYSYFYDVIIISDVRFRKEIDNMKEHFSNVVTINIYRPDYDGGLSSTQKSHATEVDLDGYSNYDYEIINDGSLEELEIKVNDLAKEL